MAGPIQAAASHLDPVFEWPVKFFTGVTTVVYVLSIITGNVSQVDRVWTFLPPIYTAYFALLPFWPKTPNAYFYPYTPDSLIPTYVARTYSPRALMMLGLQTIWMLRLTYNTWRRGLFNPNDEDYRWQVLRDKLPRWFFQVVNLTFIAIIQNIILFLLALPTEIAVRQAHVPLGPSDFILGGLSLLALFIEFIADNQQNSFQNYKRTGQHDPNAWPGSRIHWTKEDAERGFVARGLWGWSRHPNFLCEQSFWIIQNLIPILAPQPPSLKLSHGEITPLWSLTPALVICTLFFSSTLFTESITRSKYKVPYSAYQRRVAMFVPLLTPVWGLWLKLTGEKESVEELVWGKLRKE